MRNIVSPRNYILVALGACAVPSCLDRPVSELQPDTTNQVVFSVQQRRIEKLDLLFMIDNSLSMADKQDMLQRAIPNLVGRLVNPDCVAPDGRRQRLAAATDECPEGLAREFAPLEDLHIGVISSSIAQIDLDNCKSGEGADNAHLVGSLERGRGIPSYQSQGFLAWDPKGKKQPAGEHDSARLIQSVQDMVVAVGERGCGFEASLEAWYRFLVDPAPAQAFERRPCESDQARSCMYPVGVDQELLRQRAAFLRPDSLLALVMLSDENDCSIAVGAESWKLSRGGLMPRGSSACATDPSDPCCYPCDDQAPPEGCPSPDPACSLGPLSSLEDDLNLRCAQQKARFGVDFLHSTARYVEGLTKEVIRDRSGTSLRNPLFPEPGPSGGLVRTPDMVLAAGILGVPWQDVATTDETCAESAGAGCSSSLPESAPLTYLTADELTANDRWPIILGDPARGVAPTDPLMRETWEARSGNNPITGERVFPPNAGGTPRSNSINGHEWNIERRDDLQYSCTFPLLNPTDTCPSTPCECSAPAATPTSTPYDKPICQEEDGAFTTFQRYGRAFPGSRQLEVLQGIGDAAVVASICPKEAFDTASPSFGYSPAAQAIGDRVGDKLNGKCLGRELEVSSVGVLCRAVESVRADSCSCDASRGRRNVDAGLARVVRRELTRNERCGGETGVDCDALCLCEIEQATGDTRRECLEEEAASGFGWCYIDEDSGPHSQRFLRGCGPTERQLVRFVGDDTPANGSDVYVACRGATLAD